MGFIIVFIAMIFAVPAQGKDLTTRLDSILKKSGIAREKFGLAVLDLENPAKPLLYGVNEEKDFIPASITKITTAAAVLRRLGVTTKLQTGLYSSGKIEGSTLKGDLYLKGGGDSGFVSESMWFLVNEFVRTGVQKIDGNIVVDDSDFDATRTDDSREPERVDRAYDAPVGAMSFNWNSISIFIRPRGVGEAPQVYLDPIDNGYSVDNKARTVKGGGSSLVVARNGSRISVTGSIGVDHAEAPVYKNIDDPADWSGRNLIFFLKQRGISVSGQVKEGKRPLRSELLAKADSKPIAAAVTDMMKFSNNYVAEMLTKNLAHEAHPDSPATLAAGMKVIREVLSEMGISSSRFELINPSGLNRRNHMKPVDLAAVLASSYRHFPTFAEYLSALPMAGFDGTLKNRMKNSPAEGWVRAKTGLLTGVVGLAGFAGRKDGSVRAFAFIYNGKGDQGDTVRRLFDAMATELVQ